MIEIINKQKAVKLSTDEYKNITEFCLSELAKDKSLTIAFITDNEITDLNKEFRNKNAATDVLSFPNKSNEFESDELYLGDIVISVERAKTQAGENGLTVELEIKQLILHGILHLCGYDHETDEGEMNKLELELRDKLGIN